MIEVCGAGERPSVSGVSVFPEEPVPGQSACPCPALSQIGAAFPLHLHPPGSYPLHCQQPLQGWATATVQDLLSLLKGPFWSLRLPEADWPLLSLTHRNSCKPCPSPHPHPREAATWAGVPIAPG